MSTSLTCPACHTPVRAEWSHCPLCGSALTVERALPLGARWIVLPAPSAELAFVRRLVHRLHDHLDALRAHQAWLAYDENRRVYALLLTRERALSTALGQPPLAPAETIEAFHWQLL